MPFAPLGWRHAMRRADDSQEVECLSEGGPSVQVRLRQIVIGFFSFRHHGDLRDNLTSSRLKSRYPGREIDVDFNPALPNGIEAGNDLIARQISTDNHIPVFAIE